MQLSTKEKILQAARAQIQLKGFNAFSYRDLSQELGIKAASIHYHYPSKEDLGVAVIKWHQDEVLQLLASLSGNTNLNLTQKLLKFIDVIVESTYKDAGKMCLGGMFAADFKGLPDSIAIATKEFFQQLAIWLQDVLTNNGWHNADYSKDEFIKSLLSQLEGALLLGRLYKDPSYFVTIKKFIQSVVLD